MKFFKNHFYKLLVFSFLLNPCFAMEEAESPNILSLPKEQYKRLSQAFEEAKQKDILELESSSVALSFLEETIEEKWKKSENQFSSNKNDLQANFDWAAEGVTDEVAQKMAFVMQVVQQQGTSSLATSNKDFTKDMDVWIEFFARYPLLFNFKQRVSEKHQLNNFSLNVDSEIIGLCLGASVPTTIKNSFIEVIKGSAGSNGINIDNSQSKDHLMYLLLSRSYGKISSTLSIYKAQLDMETNKFKGLCFESKTANLNCIYDRVDFEINNTLALAMYDPLMATAGEEASKRLTEFFIQFAKKQFDSFDAWLKGLGYQ